MAHELRVAVDPRLRAIALELEFYAYNKLRLPNLVVQDIQRTKDEINGDAKSKHLLSPAGAIDIECADIPDDSRKELCQHAIMLGAAPVKMIRVNQRGQHIHIELPMRL